METADIISRIRWAFIAWMLFNIAALGAWLGYGGDTVLYTLCTATEGLRFRSLVEDLTHYGMYPFYGLFVGALVYSWRHRDRVMQAVGYGYLFAQIIGSVLLVRSLKMLTGHARPDALPAGAIHLHWIGPTVDASFHSFPSGHAADLFTGAMFLVLLSPLQIVRLSGFMLATAVILTRIALAQHYPIDVIAGELIAGGVSLSIMRYWLIPYLKLDKQPHTYPVIAPMIKPSSSDQRYPAIHPPEH